MDSNAQAILEPSLLGFLNVMQAGKDHTFIGELLPYKQNACTRFAFTMLSSMAPTMGLLQYK